jgi:hypothetical protein
MRIENGQVFIGNITGFSPFDKQVKFISDGNNIYMDTKDIVRLYEGIKYHEENRGVDWEKYTDSLFKDESQ